MEKTTKTLTIILADQLFENHPAFTDKNSKIKKSDFVCIESISLCQKLNYHKYKLAYLLACMREYAKFLKSLDYSVHYFDLEQKLDFESALRMVLSGNNFNKNYQKEKQAQTFEQVQYTKIQVCQPADKEFRNYLYKIIDRLKLDFAIDFVVLASPAFLTSQTDFENYLKESKNKYLMNSFYIFQRKRMGLFLDNDKPLFGKWSFDTDNRNKLKPGTKLPDRLWRYESDNYTRVAKTIEKLFANNPGYLDTSQSWLPLNFTQAKNVLNDFLDKVLLDFGTYQDAMTDKNDFVFHSVLSPMINNGLLTPNQVLTELLKKVKTWHPDKLELHFNSVEGFVRQLIGWREWVKCIYEYVYQDFRQYNFFEAKKPLPDYFYYPDKYLGNYEKGLFENRQTDLLTGFETEQNHTKMKNNDSVKGLNKHLKNTEISKKTRLKGQELEQNLPLKLALLKTHRLSWSHHIERLMILANWMTINGYDPLECYNWFLSQYVDGYDWVMAANVYGMGLFADGGLFATKPYIAGGNYIKKMSDYPDTGWSQLWTDKYWQFLQQNYEKLKNNPRMALVLARFRKNTRAD